MTSSVATIIVSFVNHIKWLSFKLNADFPPLAFPSAPKPVSSISASLSFINVGKPFPHNINIISFAIATNTSISSFPCILQDNFF